MPGCGAGPPWRRQTPRWSAGRPPCDLELSAPACPEVYQLSPEASGSRRGDCSFASDEAGQGERQVGGDGESTTLCRRLLGWIVQSLRSGLEGGTLCLCQAQRLAQQGHGATLGQATHAPLQVADAPHAQMRPLRQLLLRQAHRPAVALQQVREGGRWCACAHTAPPAAPVLRLF